MKHVQIARCEAQVTDDSGATQLVKVEIHTTDISEDVEHYQQYGLTGNVGSGVGLVVTVNGTRFVVGLNNLEKRPKGLKAGEVQVWSEHGQYVYLKEDGNIEITAPQTIVNGDIKVNGKIESTGDQIAGGISQMNHRHGNVEPGGGTTGTPQ
jgi:phage gp45-like